MRAAICIKKIAITLKYEFNHLQSDALLVCTVSNISDRNTDITKMALKALARILPSCSANFAVEPQRELIMSTLFTAMKMPDEEIQLLVF